MELFHILFPSVRQSRAASLKFEEKQGKGRASNDTPETNIKLTESTIRYNDHLTVNPLSYQTALLRYLRQFYRFGNLLGIDVQVPPRWIWGVLIMAVIAHTVL